MLHIFSTALWSIKCAAAAGDAASLLLLSSIIDSLWLCDISVQLLTPGANCRALIKENGV